VGNRKIGADFTAKTLPMGEHLRKKKARGSRKNLRQRDPVLTTLPNVAWQGKRGGNNEKSKVKRFGVGKGRGPLRSEGGKGGAEDQGEKKASNYCGQVQAEWAKTKKNEDR